MKLFIKHILIFGILFFIVEKTLYYFIQNAPNKEYDKRLQLILDGDMEKDILVLGSSRGANNISAKELEDQTGLSTYNLSYRGSNIEFHEFILSTLLKYNKSPKKVLLVLDNVFEFIHEPTLSFRFDRLFPLKKYNFINNELIKRGKKSILSKAFCSARINKKDFNLKKVSVLPINLMTSHGSKIIASKKDRKLVFNNENELYVTQNEQQIKIDVFYNIQKLCEKNNIELFFVFPPNYSNFNTSFYKRFLELVDKEHRVIIYDTLNMAYKNEIYFQDESHLLRNGASIFTSEISDFLKNKSN